MFDGMFSFIARKEVEGKQEHDLVGVRNIAHHMGPKLRR
jgi:hypothetical protein